MSRNCSFQGLYHHPWLVGSSATLLTKTLMKSDNASLLVSGGRLWGLLRSACCRGKGGCAETNKRHRFEDGGPPVDCEERQPGSDPTKHSALNSHDQTHAFWSLQSPHSRKLCAAAGGDSGGGTTVQWHPVSSVYQPTTEIFTEPCQWVAGSPIVLLAP